MCVFFFWRLSSLFVLIAVACLTSNLGNRFFLFSMDETVSCGTALSFSPDKFTVVLVVFLAQDENGIGILMQTLILLQKNEL